jgi:hypothetical protein
MCFVIIKLFEPEYSVNGFCIFYSNVKPGIASCPPIIRGWWPEKELLYLLGFCIKKTDVLCEK